MRHCLPFAASLAMLGAPALAAQEVPADGGDAPLSRAGEAFGLGQIVVVTAPRAPDTVAVGANTIGGEAIYAFNRNTLDDAINVIPGVNGANSGGSRNERLIFVRGFNRFQVPLTIDGIRVYLPADNRLDYGRFLTPDVAEIQVAKGYVSVLNGPDGMGGAINLVTRKPTRPLEIEARGTLGLDRDVDYAGYNVFGLVGTRQDRWYAQASYTRNVVDHWDLAGGFTPTAIEDGGERDLSKTEDWRVNVKLGFTPNATDEYSISYTRQEGSKLAPLSVVNPLSAQRFWTWPEWNIDSVYFLSTTQIDDRATIKTRLYRNTFYNLLRSFDNRAQNTQTLGRAFNSPYDDQAYGGSVQLDLLPFDGDRLSLAAQFRRDEHNERQQSFPSGAYEPNQRNRENTYSLAAENQLALAPTLTLTAGAGYDWRDLQVAEDYGAPLGVNPNGVPPRLFSYPLRNSSTWSAQGQLAWTPVAATRVYASVSSRGRFPTIFERFSQRFGTSIPNPELRPERATNVELGASRAFGRLTAEVAGFYSHLDDAIVSFPTLGYPCTGSTTPPTVPTPGCRPVALTQSRNLGSGEYYGGEVSLAATLGRALTLGGNYTYTHRDLDDPSNAAFRPTDVPTHKAFVYADWSPIDRVHVVPNLDIASDRWTVTDAAPIVFFRTGSYVNAGLRVDVEVVRGIVLGVGGRNLFDDDYQLVSGYPEPGRSFFASLRARY